MITRTSLVESYQSSRADEGQLSRNLGINKDFVGPRTVSGARRDNRSLEK